MKKKKYPNLHWPAHIVSIVIVTWLLTKRQRLQAIIQREETAIKRTSPEEVRGQVQEEQEGSRQDGNGRTPQGKSRQDKKKGTKYQNIRTTIYDDDNGNDEKQKSKTGETVVQCEILKEIKAKEKELNQQEKILNNRKNNDIMLAEKLKNLLKQEMVESDVSDDNGSHASDYDESSDHDDKSDDIEDVVLKEIALLLQSSRNVLEENDNTSLQIISNEESTSPNASNAPIASAVEKSNHETLHEDILPLPQSYTPQGFSQLRV